MNNVHHKPIKTFYLDGSIRDDASIARLKTEYVKLLTEEMTFSGYVPRLDIDPDFTISYNEQAEIFEFKLTMYGVFLGKKKSKWITGIDGTLIITTQKSKSSESSQERALPSRER